MKFFTKIKPYLTLKMLFGIAIGAGLGYTYYYFVGCQSGTCPITSKPFNSMVWGAFLGVVFAWPGKEGNKTEKEQP